MLTLLICVIGYLLLGGVAGGLLEGLGSFLRGKLRGAEIAPSAILSPLAQAAVLFSEEEKRIRKEQFFLAASALAFTVFAGALFFSGNDLFLSLFTMVTADLFSAALGRAHRARAGRQELLRLLACLPTMLLVCLGLYLSSGRSTVGNIPGTETMHLLRLPLLFLALLCALPVLLGLLPAVERNSLLRETESVTQLCAKLACWYRATWILGFAALFFLQQGKWWTVPAALGAAAAGYLLAVFLSEKGKRLSWSTVTRLCWLSALVLGGGNLLLLKL